VAMGIGASLFFCVRLAHCKVNVMFFDFWLFCVVGRRPGSFHGNGRNYQNLVETNKVWWKLLGFGGK
jgi:hypothetical protein